MKKNKSFILLISFLFCGFICFAQSSSSTSDKKALKLYRAAEQEIDVYRQFAPGIEKLNAAVHRDPTFIDAHLKLAQAYRALNINNSHVEKIKKHYLKVADLEPDNGAYVNVYYELAKIYYKEGNYRIAKDYLNVIKKYPSANPRIVIKAKGLSESCDFALIGLKNKVAFKPVRLPKETINQYAFNSRPVLTADQSTMVLSVRNDRGFMDENIVISNKVDGKWTPTRSISRNINSPESEGMPNISGDGKTLIFALSESKNRYPNYDLYISEKIGDEWSKPKVMGPEINTNAKESEPSLSADGRTLYFTSRRKGGFGAEDIYVSYKKDDGRWTPAENLGPSINTSKREVTPFIHADGKTLYFASDGYVGFGGTDIYYSTRVGKYWTIPVNIGFPINTSSNEGSMYISPDYAKGYYEVYETRGVKSYSAIYEFDFPEHIKAKYKCQYMKGKVYDAKTKKPLDAQIILTDLFDDEISQKVTSDKENGNYLIVLKEGREYALHVEKEGYLFHSINFDFKKITSFDPVLLDIYLEPIEKGAKTVLSNVFYKTGKFELSNKSKTELDKVIKLLETNSTLKLKIAGHTDNIGSKENNQTLSYKRANAVFTYLTEKGIDAGRLAFRGYGDTTPITNNTTEEGRAQNRRIEVEVF